MIFNSIAIFDMGLARFRDRLPDLVEEDPITTWSLPTALSDCPGLLVRLQDIVLHGAPLHLQLL